MELINNRQVSTIIAHHSTINCYRNYSNHSSDEAWKNVAKVVDSDLEISGI